jgi:ribonuclease P protein component
VKTERYLFQRFQRLLKQADFKYVFDKPEKSKDVYFTVLARPNSLAYARLGIILSKKRIKHSVMRNRIKRLIRYSFRVNQHSLLNKDFVVLANDKSVEEKNSSILNSLAMHWQQLSHRCENS